MQDGRSIAIGRVAYLFAVDVEKQCHFDMATAVLQEKKEQDVPLPFKIHGGKANWRSMKSGDILAWPIRALKPLAQAEGDNGAGCVFMTREAWRNVQPLTIQNCFRKAGLTTVVQPEDSATPQPADIAVLIPEGMTEEEFNEFVDLDADVECTEDPGEEEICQEVRESRGTTFTTTEADDDVDFESSPPPVPSSAEVSTALDVLLRWMQCHDDSEYSHFARIEGIVQEINQQRHGVEKA
ncbi:tigger transposable element-derived protein 4-like [Branchiostoma lanceolatum]|uniref:tigger transposable element-derived protein 4-like n=1 Tax=Branchiostoma lanceolatum TaxID=7740 RepID=UPI003454D929